MSISFEEFSLEDGVGHQPKPGSAHLEEQAPLIDKSVEKEAPVNLDIVYTLPSLSELTLNLEKYDRMWEVNSEILGSAHRLYSDFYRAYTAPPFYMHAHELESLRLLKLVELYNYIDGLEENYEPLQSLQMNIGRFLKVYLMVPAEADLAQAIADWTTKRAYKPDLIGPLPARTSAARVLDDLVQLDFLLENEDVLDDPVVRQEEIHKLKSRLANTSPNIEKERRYRQCMQPKKVLDLFKNGTYGLVGLKYQTKLNAEGWKRCNEDEREKYRVYSNFSHQQFLKHVVEGKGADLKISFAAVTTENKKAFIRHPEKDAADAENTAMFTIDPNGRMYLFGAEDHENGLTPASVMNCEPVLFAGNIISEVGHFELHASSKEYKTNQHMCRHSVHYLQKQANIINEDSIVLSAPILRTEQAEIRSGAETKQEIERAKLQALNLGGIFDESRMVFWHKRPDVIFPTDGSIPTDILTEDEETQAHYFAAYRNIKHYICSRFGLVSANDIWRVNADEFQQLMLDLKNPDDVTGDFYLGYDFITDTQIQDLEEYYNLRRAHINPNIIQQPSLSDIIPPSIFPQIYDMMFETSEHQEAHVLKEIFEESAQKRNISTEGIDAIWSVGSKAKFHELLTTLINNTNNKSLLTPEEFREFRNRACVENKDAPQKGARFDELLASDKLPENPPELFTDEEFVVVQEAHQLVTERKNALTDYYYTRRKIGSTPERNLENFMYGEIYSEREKHPWEEHRVGIYLGILIASVILSLIITSYILFAPGALALSLCSAHFFAKVLLGYLVGLLVGGVFGSGAAAVGEKLFEPKPVDMKNQEYRYERWPFYQLNEAENSTLTYEAEQLVL